MAGLEKIQELDKILKEKTQVAKSLKKSRLERDSGVSDTTSDDEDDMDELKSIHSMDTRTFITEPKMGARSKDNPPPPLSTAPSVTRIPIGKQALEAKTTHAEAKTYKPGDFIQRNIALGPESRYYQ